MFSIPIPDTPSTMLHSCVSDSVSPRITVRLDQQYFVYQTLRALKTMHSADIVHRDLKPANLLLNANCDLKVCDFGLARSTRSTNPGGKEAGLMTEYVATRWYRAPEIMLSFKMYTKAIDIWAVGCILAELLNGRPLFPGRDYGHQLDLILDVIGTPTLEEFYGITSRRSRDYIRALPIRKRRPFTALFPKASPDAIDFLQKTLVSPSVVCRAPVSLRSTLGGAAVAIVPCTMRIRALRASHGCAPRFEYL